MCNTRELQESLSPQGRGQGEGPAVLFLRISSDILTSSTVSIQHVPHHEASARLSSTGGAAHNRAPRTHPRAPGDEGKRSGDGSHACASRAGDRIAVRSRHPAVLSLLQENCRRGETSVCRRQDKRGRRVRRDRVLDGQHQAGAEAMARDGVRVWYDAKGDYLEVLFDQRPGYFRETTNDQVMEKVDAEGNVLGFSVLKV